MPLITYHIPSSQIVVNSSGGEITAASSEVVEITYTQGKYVLTGSFSTFGFLSGTVESVEIFSDGGEKAVSYEGLEMDLGSYLRGSPSVVTDALLGPDVVNGSYGADYIGDTLGGGDRIYAHGGNDFIIVFPGSNLVDGGTGIDTARLVGVRTETEIFRVNDNSFETTRDGTTDTNTLTSVERLQFTDGTLAFDVNEKAGQAYRLYQAAFDRTPDAEGLGFWIDHYDAGNVDLVEMAGWFMQSEEFATKYGAPETVSDEAFLTLLYNNVLDRDPDQEGFDFWRGHQDNGLTRAEMIQYFSESQENYANVASSIEDGIWFV